MLLSFSSFLCFRHSSLQQFTSSLATCATLASWWWRKPFTVRPNDVFCSFLDSSGHVLTTRKPFNTGSASQTHFFGANALMDQTKTTIGKNWLELPISFSWRCLNVSPVHSKANRYPEKCWTVLLPTTGYLSMKCVNWWIRGFDSWNPGLSHHLGSEPNWTGKKTACGDVLFGSMHLFDSGIYLKYELPKLHFVNLLLNISYAICIPYTCITLYNLRSLLHDPRLRRWRVNQNCLVAEAKGCQDTASTHQILGKSW